MNSPERWETKALGRKIVCSRSQCWWVMKLGFARRQGDPKHVSLSLALWGVSGWGHTMKHFSSGTASSEHSLHDKVPWSLFKTVNVDMQSS
jgi:hypothetical protein